MISVIFYKDMMFHDILKIPILRIFKYMYIHITNIQVKLNFNLYNFYATCIFVISIL